VHGVRLSHTISKTAVLRARAKGGFVCPSASAVAVPLDPTGPSHAKESGRATPDSCLSVSPGVERRLLPLTAGDGGQAAHWERAPERSGTVVGAVGAAVGG
jgi:hypothetical protein